MFYQKASLLMKIKTTALILMTGVLPACTESPVKVVPEPVIKVAHNPYVVDQRLDLGRVSMSGPLSYAYKIYGDPVAAPAQVFSDDSFLYLQLNKGQLPPIPITRDGALVEYEVKRNFMIMSKVDSLVLRLGPRKAYVDKEDLEIIHYQSAMKPEYVPMALDVEISSPVLSKKLVVKKPVQPLLKERFEFSVEDVIKAESLAELGLNEIGVGMWRVCTPQSSTSFSAAIKLQLKLSIEGWNVEIDPKCKANNAHIILEKQ